MQDVLKVLKLGDVEVGGGLLNVLLGHELTECSLVDVRAGGGQCVSLVVRDAGDVDPLVVLLLALLLLDRHRATVGLSH